MENKENKKENEKKLNSQQFKKKDVRNETLRYY